MLRRPLDFATALACPVVAGVALILLAGPALAQSAASGSGNSGSEGARIYKDGGCFTCHGELGFGGAGPRLRNDPFLLLNDYVIGQILVGRGIMPSFASRLSDAQVAAVASYIRTSWGNDYGAVGAQQVGELRQRFARKFPNQPLSQVQRAAPPLAAEPNGGEQK